MFPKERVCKYGFCRPHAYRGYYDQVAFEPTENVTIESMLVDVDNALDWTFEGWKGGEFWYNEKTPVNFAKEGMCTEDDEYWANYSEKLLLSISGVL